MKNVLLITIDSLRADHVGYHGYQRNTTPIIDEYAAKGSRFLNTFAHAGGTRFSFPSILTGVTPLMYGGYDRVSKEQTLISEVFSEAGYQTGGIHSNLYISAEFGYDRGWDLFFDSAPDQSSTASIRKWVKTNLSGTYLFKLLRAGYDFMEASAGVNVGSYHIPADEITDRAIEFINSTSNSNGPVFLWVHYMDVHHPFLPPEEFQLHFRDTPISNRDSIKLRRKFIEEPDSVSERELQTFIDLYDAEIRYNDSQIGRLLNHVEEAWGGNRLLALTADHGDHFLEHGYFGGARGLDVKTHVPLFIEGWDDKNEYTELVGLTDLPTTLLAASGLPIPRNFYGNDLRKLVFEDEWNRDHVIGGWEPEDGEHLHIREQEWKLIQHPVGKKDELYHLTEDPSEHENVLESFPKEATRLGEKLEKHRELVDATNDESVERPDMGEDVKERLRRLGYQE